MKNRRAVGPALSPAVALGLGACPATPAVESDHRPSGNSYGASRVLNHSDLGSHASLLEALDRRVPNLRISAGGACPLELMRGHTSITGISGGPLVYVDGARTMDTCVLAQLHSPDVQRVELYPSGFRTGPGYDRNGGGPILILSRKAGDLLAR